MSQAATTATARRIQNATLELQGAAAELLAHDEELAAAMIRVSLEALRIASALIDRVDAYQDAVLADEPPQPPTEPA